MKILIINCGSSSIKYQLFDMQAGQAKALVKGLADKVGSPDSFIVHQKGASHYRAQVKLPDYFRAIETIVGLLEHPQRGAINNRQEIAAIGHRVVHGGEEFTSSVRITKKVLQRIKDYFKLAPLHNPPSYNGITAAMKTFPGVTQVAVFDTAFHQTMPQEAYMYALPYALYQRYGIRRYGFHGTSHRYVASAAARLLRKPLRKLKLITCYLGNGCSITAVKYGRSVDTSMGFTPLEGLVMGTRCGDIDPALVGFIMEKERLSLGQVNDLMNRKSGLLGLSGISNDMRDLLDRAKAGNKRAKLAIDVFIYRVKKYIGAYFAVMNGADAVILTAGIGENVAVIKNRLQRELSVLLAGRVPIVALHTDEETLIALDTYELVKERR